MKAFKLVSLIIFILVINNIVLLKVIGVFQQGSKPGSVLPSTLVTGTHSKEIAESSLPQRVEPLDQNIRIDGALDVDEKTVSVIHQAFDQFIESERFEEVMDNYSQNAQRRYREAQQRLSSMDINELYSLLLNSDNLMEKRLAMQAMSHGKWNDLDNAQLKSLYQQQESNNFGQWAQSELISTLVKRGDDEALNWAKQRLQQGQSESHFDYDLFATLHVEDPKFMHQLIDRYQVPSTPHGSNFVNYVLSNQDLSQRFVERKLDQIIASGNSVLYEHVGHNANVNFSPQQEIALNDLFASDNRYKRILAIGLARNVQDRNRLREYFSRLTQPRDQMFFLNTLKASSTGTERVTLIKELAAMSENSEVRAIGK